MAGTKTGGVKARNTNYSQHGSDFYKRIGALGGSTPTTIKKGFATMNPERHKEVSSKGGKWSRHERTRMED